ncbi:hypothetical protein JRO89_XS13G0228500 [Xanthoceras sorbifolium]|uniref:DUF4283 domain-containing protein n=1 Tax=Xanthoceras sorbifolium TaxID=99658 RepID=A0ABQ8H9K9_9ROSI|nr:hypothetical protein JRO89_XS13G0228500 [Xanthoceras sorbifolium]
MLKGGPWSFDNALLVLEVPTGSGSLANMRFGYAEFWVQLHNVPLLCLTKDIGYFLGSQIGQVVEVDSTPSGDCLGKYLHTHVRIDIRKPLKRHPLRDCMANTVDNHMASDTPSPPSTESHNKGGTKVGMGSKSARPIVLSASPVALEEVQGSIVEQWPLVHEVKAVGLMQGGQGQHFEVNNILAETAVDGAPLMFKGSITGRGIPSNAEYGTRRKGWKRRARTGMVIMDELQDLVQLGKREESTQESQTPCATRIFHYESCWAGLEQCSKLIKAGWTNSGHDLCSVLANIKTISLSLSRWNQLHRATLRADNNRAHRKLDSLTSTDVIGSWSEIRQVESELDNLLATDEEYWRQRSRVEWLRSGDRNTRLFHA